MEAKQTPLIELLEQVPHDARVVVEHDQFSSSSHPVGRLCHEAAAALRARLAQPEMNQWVGLTDEEVYECEQLAAIQYQRHKYSVHGQIITPADGLEWHFAGVIEAKLKEKNT